jgi:hypothetical protein
MLRRLVVGTAILCGVVAWQAPAAFPWYSLVSATMSCDGTVDWTASAWNGPTPDSRYNPDILVSASFDNGVTFERIAEHAFDASDNYQFAGIFAAGNERSVLVRVQELANWPAAGGDVPGPPHYATATRPTNCAPPTTVVKAARHTITKKKTPPPKTTTKTAPPRKPKTVPVKSTKPLRPKPKHPAKHTKKPAPAHPKTLPFTK